MSVSATPVKVSSYLKQLSTVQHKNRAEIGRQSRTRHANPLKYIVTSHHITKRREVCVPGYTNYFVASPIVIYHVPFPFISHCHFFVRNRLRSVCALFLPLPLQDLWVTNCSCACLWTKLIYCVQLALEINREVHLIRGLLLLGCQWRNTHLWIHFKL